MKKFSKFVACTSSLLLPLLFASHASALESETTCVMTEEQINTEFEGLKDDQTVVALPDGGIIFNVNSNYVYTDADAKVNQGYVSTVGQLKEDYKTKEFITSVSVIPQQILPQASGLVSKCRVLNSGEVYRSASFSGGGWRFSGQGYKPAPGTGAYLGWQTFNDDGRVGSYNQASRTLGGNPTGTLLYRGARRYIMCQYDQPYYYYTYNPVSGTYYVVDNI
ncbi:signal peptide [Streptococcus agalactiae]|jgi:hypothetical protein|uniref:hypothetical protein n=1 Tax=Streptococcus TaxID=1301 RepID=UPI000E083AC7|nr:MULTISPECIES: hypothetical protein [Streptococcus]SUN07109.1 signal peptide [Streptococcus agalactiae]